MNRILSTVGQGREIRLHTRSDPAAILLLAIFVASAVSGSLLVSGTADDLIVIVPVIALCLLGIRELGRRALMHLGRPVAWIMTAYVATSALTVLVSLSRSTSLKYLVGSAAVIAVGFVVLPA